MNGQKNELHTQRLRLIPLTLTQFNQLLEDTVALELNLGLEPSHMPLDAHTRDVMSALYEEAVANPQDIAWYTNWHIILVTANMLIGSAGFRGGPDTHGEVEIGYGINAAFQRNGYAPEAVNALCNWALRQPGVRRVVAEAERGNNASCRVLQACGMHLYRETPTSLWWGVSCKTAHPAAAQTRAISL